MSFIIAQFILSAVGIIIAVLDFAFPSAFRHTTFSPKFLHHSLAAVPA